VFAQQSLQPKLSCRRYASDSYALQKNALTQSAKVNRTESMSGMDYEQSMGMSSTVSD